MQRFKWTTLCVLILISIMVVWINTIGLRHFTVPMTSDEQEYMGMANQIIEFDTIPFHEGRGFRVIFATALGLFFGISPLDNVITIRILHAALLVAIVLGFYKLGRIESKPFGFLLAIFVALFSIPSFSLGFVGLYPALVVYALVPFFFHALIQGKKLLALVHLGIMLLVHPMIALPIVLSGVLFEIMKSKPRWGISLIALGLAVAFMAHPFLLERWGRLKFLESAITNEMFTIFWPWWIPLTVLSLFGGGMVLLWRREAQKWEPYLLMAMSLFVIFDLFLFGSGVSYGFMRVLIPPVMGILIIGSIGCMVLLEKLEKAPNYYRFLGNILILIIVTIFFKTAILVNTQDQFYAPPNTLEEIKAYEWLEKTVQDSTKILLISDFKTMEAAHYYLPLTNSVELENYIFEQASFTNQVPEEAFLKRIKPYQDFMAALEFTDQSLQWLQEKRKQYKPEATYIFLGPRTFYNLYRYGFDPSKANFMVIPREALRLPKEYLKKFLESPQFEVVYSTKEILILKVVP